MHNVFNKLSVRSTDYVACVDVEDDRVLSSMQKSAKAIVCAGKVGKNNFEGLKNIKVVKKIKNLDDGIFNKVLCNYNDELNLKSVVRITEHSGLVLICNVPEDKSNIFESILLDKAGVLDFWPLKNERKGSVDILFKVHHYQ